MPGHKYTLGSVVQKPPMNITRRDMMKAAGLLTAAAISLPLMPIFETKVGRPVWGMRTFIDDVEGTVVVEEIYADEIYLMRSPRQRVSG